LWGEPIPAWREHDFIDAFLAINGLISDANNVSMLFVVEGETGADGMLSLLAEQLCSPRLGVRTKASETKETATASLFTSKAFREYCLSNFLSVSIDRLTCQSKQVK
jgi:hypothetical protein